jgi:hypothetical protein
LLDIVGFVDWTLVGATRAPSAIPLGISTCLVASFVGGADITDVSEITPIVNNNLVVPADSICARSVRPAKVVRSSRIAAISELAGDRDFLGAVQVELGIAVVGRWKSEAKTDAIVGIWEQDGGAVSRGADTVKVSQYNPAPAGIYIDPENRATGRVVIDYRYDRNHRAWHSVIAKPKTHSRPGGQ